MKRHDSGAAAVLITLFTLLIIAILLTTVTLSGYRSRNDVARDAQAYQAFLAADSGLSTLIARLKASNFSGSLSQAKTALNELGSTPRYLTDGADQASGPRVTLSVVGEPDTSDSSLVVKAVGKFGGGARPAEATITQRVRVIQPLQMSSAPPAALTSCPSIDGGGTAYLGGKAMSYNGIIDGVGTITSASPASVTGSWPATLTMSKPSSYATDKTDLVGFGSYVQVNGVAYRVTSVVSDTSTTKSVAVVPLTSAPLGSSLTGTMNLLSIIVTDGITLRSNGNYQIPVSDSSAFYPSDVVYFNSGGVSWGLTVIKKGFRNGDTDLPTIEVQLGALGAGGKIYDGSGNILGSVSTPTALQLLNLPVGTVLRRYVAGATSRNDIQNKTGIVPAGAWSGSSAVSPAAVATNPNVQCGDALFEQVFNNISKQSYYDLVEPANRLSSIGKPLTKGLYWLGPPPGSTPGYFTLNGNELCGFGVLVVNGNLNMKGTGNLNTSLNACTASGSPNTPQGFSGVIYVAGDFANQGNSIIKGAMIVEGRTTLNLNDTSLAGTMNIQYDLASVMASTRYLSPLKFNYGDGTWSQQ